METPVLVVPRHERSFEVLVGHLGEIRVRNEVITGNELMNEQLVVPDCERIDRVMIQIKDMNVHSLNLTEKFENHGDDSLNLLSHFRDLTSQNLYSCLTSAAIPILHDTELEIRGDKIARSGNLVKESSSYNSFMFGDLDVNLTEDFSKSSNLIQIQGKVVNPLKLSLLRSQYEQILDSVKSIIEHESEHNEDLSSKSRKASFKDASLDASANEEVTPVEGSFEISQVILELRGDLMTSDKKSDTIVCLECEDFAVYYEKHEKDKTNMEVALKSLVMEDLQLDVNSKHRKLMSSTSGLGGDQAERSRPHFTSGLSTSCPDNSPFLDPDARPVSKSGSLPDLLEPEPAFGKPKRRQSSKSARKSTRRSIAAEPEEPETPPPSTASSRASPIFGEPVRRDLQKAENLVHIKILNVDSKSENFLTKYNCTNRFVEVDFNTLDIVFNLQTWVIVLDFFGIGSRPGQTPESAPITRKYSGRLSASSAKKTPMSSKIEHFNTDIDIKVKSLSLVLNRPEYEIASASAKSFASKISLRDGNFAIGGRLGSFGIKDLTEQGVLYRDRFVSKGGENILTFQFFKYGSDDEKLKRPHDATLKLRMASIVYVHTHRFNSELLTFFNQFHQLQSVMNRVREAAAGGKV